MLLFQSRLSSWVCCFFKDESWRNDQFRIASAIPCKVKKRKPKEEPEDEEDPEEMENPMMDMFGMTDSVTVRDNDIYFYCSVNKKNIVKSQRKKKGKYS